MPDEGGTPGRPPAVAPTAEQWAEAIQRYRPIVIDSLTELQRATMATAEAMHNLQLRADIFPPPPDAPRVHAPPGPPVICHECQSEGIIEIHDSWCYCECPAGVEQERRASAEMMVVLQERQEQERAESGVPAEVFAEFDRRIDSAFINGTTQTFGVWVVTAPGRFGIVPVTTRIDRDGVLHTDYRVTAEE